MPQYILKKYAFCIITTMLIIVPACRKTDPSKKTIKHDPRIEQVFNNILDAWNQLDSISVRLSTMVAQASGGRGKTIGDGIYHLSKNESRTRIHFKLANALQRKLKDDPSKKISVTEYLYYVTDGDTMFHAKIQYNGSVVIKSKYESSKIMQLGGKKYLQNIKDTHRLNYLSDTIVNGRDVYLIEAIPLEGDWKRLYYFDKETGLQMKLVERNLDGEDIFTMELFEFNPMVEYAPEQFQYTVPEDAKFIDQTKD